MWGLMGILYKVDPTWIQNFRESGPRTFRKSGPYTKDYCMSKKLTFEKFERVDFKYNNNYLKF